MNHDASPAGRVADPKSHEGLARPADPELAGFPGLPGQEVPGLGERAATMLAQDDPVDELPGGGETMAALRQAGLREPPRDFMASDYVAPAGEHPGDIVGHYILLEVIGEGGFGTVWSARQQQPVQRTVALKIIKPGMDSREVLKRFEHERQALAMMDHPGITRVFDAGATAAGRPYFVMELIAGEPVTSYCDSRRLDTPGRLRLVAEVCATVHHAHQKGIIHRDLKPSNVLVAEQDGRPTPKIIDFGIAKAVTPGGDTFHSQTRADQFIGTPAYMSPEQASLEGSDVDTRTDVYSLGVLLYQLLTGMMPFEGKTSRGASLDEIRRIIRDEDPPAPSTAVGRLHGEVLTRVLQSRKTALRQLNQLLRRDLDWIVMKALEKDRTRRYQSASALAEDLQRYLAGEPVAARPPTFSYRAGKFIRRRKVPVAASALVMVSLIGGLAASTTLYLREKAALGRESNERAKTQREAVNHARTAAFLSDLLSGASPEQAQGKAPTVLDLVEGAADQVSRGLENQPAVEASLRNTIGSTFFSLGRFTEAEGQFKTGLELARTAVGERDRLTLRLRGNLANILHAKRDYAAAEAENRALLEIRQSEFPPDDIESLATRDNLATAISKQGRYAEAAAEYRALLPLQEKALSEDHPDTLRTRMALANIQTRLCLDEKGRVVDAPGLQAAETEYRDVIIRLTGAPTLGPNHPQTLEARYGLADVLYFQTRFSDAEREHSEVLALRQKVLSPTHKKTFQSQAAVGRALYGQGKLDEAIAVFEQIVEAQKVAPDRDESDYQMNLKTLETLQSVKSRRPK